MLLPLPAAIVVVPDTTIAALSVTAPPVVRFKEVELTPPKSKASTSRNVTAPPLATATVPKALLALFKVIALLAPAAKFN